MAYELNLTEEQYEAAYEINLDYLMSVNSMVDLYGANWAHRNMDFNYILCDWQYRAYMEANYFYRPLRWDAGYWHFSVYARYPRRDYYYFGRPNFYSAYRGAHSWRMNGDRSWYYGRDLFYGRNNSNYYGMRDSFNRGYYDRGYNGYSSYDNSFPQNGRPRSFGNQQRSTFDGPQGMTRTYEPRESSTRTTVTRPNNNSGFGANRSFGNATRGNEPTRSFDNPRPSFSNPSPSFSTPRGSFGNGSSFGGSRSTGGSTSNIGSVFGGHR